MWDCAGIVRNEIDLKRAEVEINKLKQEFKRDKKCLNKDEYEYRNMLTISSLIVGAAILRKESRGAHCRSDYSVTKTEPVHSSIIKQEERLLSNVV